jgi:hypothetical protein
MLKNFSKILKKFCWLAIEKNYPHKESLKHEKICFILRIISFTYLKDDVDVLYQWKICRSFNFNQKKKERILKNWKIINSRGVVISPLPLSRLPYACVVLCHSSSQCKHNWWVISREVKLSIYTWKKNVDERDHKISQKFMYFVGDLWFVLCLTFMRINCSIVPFYWLIFYGLDSGRWEIVRSNKLRTQINRKMRKLTMYNEEEFNTLVDLLFS